MRYSNTRLEWDDGELADDEARAGAQMWGHPICTLAAGLGAIVATLT